MASAVKEEKKIEIDKVYENRYWRFKEVLGEHPSLESLAKSDVHPTEIENLLSQGCHPDIAVKILL